MSSADAISQKQEETSRRLGFFIQWAPQDLTGRMCAWLTLTPALRTEQIKNCMLNSHTLLNDAIYMFTQGFFGEMVSNTAQVELNGVRLINGRGTGFIRMLLRAKPFSCVVSMEGNWVK